MDIAKRLRELRSCVNGTDQTPTPDLQSQVIDLIELLLEHFFAEKSSQGTKDHFALCGQVAVEELALDENHNSPAEVRTAIQKLKNRAGREFMDEDPGPRKPIGPPPPVLGQKRFKNVMG